MLRSVILSALMVSCVASITRAQNVCGTDAVYQKYKSEHPEIAEYEQRLEQAIKEGVYNANLGKFARTTAASDTTTYDIPIVVHIVHDYGNENVTDNAVFETVKVWQDVFLGRNADTSDVIKPFKKYVGNPRIRLHLATKDPQGNPTKGIVRHHSYWAFNGSDQAKLGQWPQESYLNIWFVNVFDGDHAGAAAYAMYPSMAAGVPYYDGVISLASYLNVDKTIPHEIGHVLNLQHVWGNTNNPNVACGDDQVDDTPPTKGHVPSNCANTAAIYDVTCAGGYTKTYKNIHNIDSVVDYPDTVNAQNIMDYTYCEKMFTKGQVERMRSALTNATANRNNLITPQNLSKTGAMAAMKDLAPIADFSVERASGAGLSAERAFFLCANNNVSFALRNQSWNDTIANVEWTFSNGATNPTGNTNLIYNKFSEPGWVTISLKANSNAGSNTVTRQAIYVADNAAIIPGPTQEFNNANDMAKWPIFNYYENQFKWELYNGAGYADNTSIRYKGFDARTSPENRTNSAQGDYDDFYTPAYDLTKMNGGDANLNFYTSGASVGYTGWMDTLEVWASNTCGFKWERIARIGGNDLANNGTKSTEFVPNSATQWKPRTVAVPTAYLTDKTFFRLRYKPGDKSNDVYVDRFSISSWSTDVKEVAGAEVAFKIYPNPATDGCNIAFNTGNNGNVRYEVKDMAGKTLYSRENNYQPNTLVQEYISRSVLPAAGVYFVTLTVSNNIATQKLVIY